MTDRQKVADRLRLLREQLQREHMSAYIFPTTDPHQSEYTADHWKAREWISGFDGSAGTAVVTLHGAALWTDSRYFIAAEQQLQGTEYQLMRLRMEGTPTIAEWLGAQLADAADKTVGIDGMVWSESETESLRQQLARAGGLTLQTNLDIINRIWNDRPDIPSQPIVAQPLEYAGEATASKLARIRRALREQHADGMLVASLDDIAWTLNIRGNDVHCCPVAVAYLLISSQHATLYIDPRKVDRDLQQALAHDGISVADYDSVKDGLKHYAEYNILLDADEICHTLYHAIQRKIVNGRSPIPAMKAVKNEAEQQGFRQAMVRDGVAMVRFLKWLDEELPKGQLTEMSVAAHLERLRASQAHYRGLSFDTIAAYGPHGAIVHYEPTMETDIPLQQHSMLLLDSGAHYQDGTTDITRTIAMGPLTDEERRVYTLVLKGHIALQRLTFPDGASGTQLDAVARQSLWAYGYNFLHGTGHGVGAYLNVHEGPQQIRMEWVAQPLRAGMTITDEPGIYLKDRFGVRIENTLLIVPAMTTECGRFLRFETLTLCPIDRRPIIIDMMTSEERQWFDHYHQRVYETLAPQLTENEKQWLKNATKPL